MGESIYRGIYLQGNLSTGESIYDKECIFQKQSIYENHALTVNNTVNHRS
jgi:hypothetical protein